MSGVVIEATADTKKAEKDLAQLNSKIAQMANNAKLFGGNMFKNLGQNQSLERTTKQLRTVQEETKKADSASQTMHRNMQKDSAKTNSMFGSIVTTVTALSTAFLALKGTSAFNKVSDDLTDLHNRLKLVTNSTQDLINTQQRLYQLSKDTRSELSQTVSLYTDMTMALERYGYSQQRVMKVVKTISQTNAMSGSSADAIKGAMTQLQQGIASGTIRGEELNSVLEQNKYLSSQLQKNLEMNTGALRKFAEAGSFTTDLFFRTVEKMSEKVGDDFKKTAIKTDQAIVQMNKAFSVFFGEFNQYLGFSDAFSKRILGIASAVDTLNTKILGTSIAFRQGFSNYLGNYNLIPFEEIKKGEISLKGYAKALQGIYESPAATDIVISAVVNYDTALDLAKSATKISKYKKDLEDFLKRDSVSVNYAEMAYADLTPEQKKAADASVKADKESFKERLTLYKDFGIAVFESLSITFSNISRLIPKFTRPLVEYLDLAKIEISKQLLAVNTAVATSILPAARKIEGFSEAITGYLIKDTRLERSWVNLLRSNSLEEFKNNLEALNSARTRFIVNDKAYLASELKRIARLNSSYYELRESAVRSGIIPQSILSVLDSRLDRVKRYFTEIGLVGKRVYEDLVEPYVSGYSRVIGAYLLGVAKAYDSAFKNLFTRNNGEALANDVVSLVKGMYDSIKSLSFNIYESLFSKDSSSSGIVSAISKISSAISSTFLGNLPQFFAGFFSTLFKPLENSLKYLASSVNSVIQSILFNISELIEKIKTLASEASQAFSKLMPKDFSGIVSIENTLSVISQHYTKMVESVSTKTKDFEGIFKKISDFTEKVDTAFFEVYDSVVGHSWWPDLVDGVNFYTDKLIYSQNKVKSFTSAIDKDFKATMANVNKYLHESQPKIASYVDKFMDMSFSGLAHNITSSITAAIIAGFAFASESALAKFGGILYLFGAFNTELVEAFGISGGLLANVVGQGLGHFLAVALQGLGPALFEAAPSLIKSFLDGLAPIDIKSLGFISDIIAFVPGLSSIFSNLTIGLLTAAVGISLVSSKFRSFVDEIAFGKTKKLKGGGVEVISDGVIPSILSMFSNSFTEKAKKGTLVKNKPMAVAAIGTFLLGIFNDSVSLLDSAVIGTPLLLWSILGKDGGNSILRKAYGVFDDLLQSVANKMGKTTVLGKFVNLFASLSSSVISSMSGSVKAETFLDKTVASLEIFRHNSKLVLADILNLREAFTTVYNKSSMETALKGFDFAYSRNATSKEFASTFGRSYLSAGIVDKDAAMWLGKMLHAADSFGKMLKSMLTTVITFFANSFSDMLSSITSLGMKSFKQLGLFIASNKWLVGGAIVIGATLFSGFASAATGMSEALAIQSASYIELASSIAIFLTALYAAKKLLLDLPKYLTALHKSTKLLVAMPDGSFSKTNYFLEYFKTMLTDAYKYIVGFFPKLVDNFKKGLAAIKAAKASILERDSRENPLMSILKLSAAPLDVAVDGLDYLGSKLKKPKEMVIEGVSVKNPFQQFDGFGSLDRAAKASKTLKENLADAGKPNDMLSRMGSIVDAFFPSIAQMKEKYKAIGSIGNVFGEMLRAVSPLIGIFITEPFKLAARLIGATLTLALSRDLIGAVKDVGRAISLYIFGTIKNVVNVIPSLIRGFWNLGKAATAILKKPVFIAGAVGTIGLIGVALLGPGDHIMDKMKMLYDMARKIIGLEVTTSVGKQEEILNQLRPYNFDTSKQYDRSDYSAMSDAAFKEMQESAKYLTIDFMDMAQAIDYSKLSARQFSMLNDAVKESVETLNRLSAEQFKNGSLSAESSQEAVRVKSDLERLLGRQVKVDSESFGSVVERSDNTLSKTNTDIFRAIKIWSGWTPVLEETNIATESLKSKVISVLKDISSIVHNSFTEISNLLVGSVVFALTKSWKLAMLSAISFESFGSIGSAIFGGLALVLTRNLKVAAGVMAAYEIVVSAFSSVFSSVGKYAKSVAVDIANSDTGQALASGAKSFYEIVVNAADTLSKKIDEWAIEQNNKRFDAPYKYSTGEKEALESLKKNFDYLSSSDQTAVMSVFDKYADTKRLSQRLTSNGYDYNMRKEFGSREAWLESAKKAEKDLIKLAAERYKVTIEYEKRALEGAKKSALRERSQALVKVGGILGSDLGGETLKNLLGGESSVKALQRISGEQDKNGKSLVERLSLDLTNKAFTEEQRLAIKLKLKEIKGAFDSVISGLEEIASLKGLAESFSKVTGMSGASFMMNAGRLPFTRNDALYKAQEAFRIANAEYENLSVDSDSQTISEKRDARTKAFENLLSVLPNLKAGFKEVNEVLQSFGASAADINVISTYSTSVKNMAEALRNVSNEETLAELNNAPLKERNEIYLRKQRLIESINSALERMKDLANFKLSQQATSELEKLGYLLSMSSVSMPDNIRRNSSKQSEWIAMANDVELYQKAYDKVKSETLNGVLFDPVGVALAEKALYRSKKSLELFEKDMSYSISDMSSKFSDSFSGFDSKMFLGMSDKAKAELKEIYSEIQALETERSLKPDSELANSDLEIRLKRELEYQTKARALIVSEAYKTSKQIDDLLGGAVSESMFAVSPEALQNLLDIKKAVDDINYGMQFKSGELYLEEAKKRAELLKREARLVEDINFNSSNRLSKTNEMFGTAFDTFSFAKLPDSLAKAISKDALKLQRALSDAIERGEYTLNILAEIDYKQTLLSLASFFLEFENGLNKAFKNGVSGAYSIVQKVFGDVLTQLDFYRLSPEKRKDVTGSALDIDKLERLMTSVYLTPDMANILDKFDGSNASKILADVESNYKDILNKVFGEDLPSVMGSLTTAIEKLEGTISKLLPKVDSEDRYLPSQKESDLLRKMLKDRGVELSEPVTSGLYTEIPREVGQVSGKTLELMQKSKNRKGLEISKEGSPFNRRKLLSEKASSQMSDMDIRLSIKDAQVTKYLANMEKLTSQMTAGTSEDLSELQVKYNEQKAALEDYLDGLNTTAMLSVEVGRKMRDAMADVLNQGLLDILKGTARFEDFGDLILDTLTNSILENFVTAFMDPLTGKNGIISQGISSFGNWFASQIAMMFANQQAASVGSSSGGGLFGTVFSAGLSYLGGGGTSGGVTAALSLVGGGSGSFGNSVASMADADMMKKLGYSGFATFATGGYVSGAGTGTSDSIVARISNGEYVVNAKATAENLGLLNAINYGKVPKFATGGLVSTDAIQPTIGTFDAKSVQSVNNSSEQVFNINITGDISRQTKSEIIKMLPQIASGINAVNKEKGIRR